jgi:xanthine dehydrogenase accessory factor
MWHLGTKLLHENGPALYREYQLNEELSDQGGLVCGGTMSFILEPFPAPAEAIGLFERLDNALDSGPPVAVITFLESADKQTTNYTRRVIDDAGDPAQQSGMSEQVVEMAHTILRNGGQKLLEPDTDTKIYIEGYSVPPALLLIGAGHVNTCVADLAGRLGYRIHIVDDREEFANRERFPIADSVFVRDYDAGLKDIPVTTNTAVVIATRGHHFDDVALAAAIQTQASYIGLVGSKRKTALIFRKLRKNGVNENQLARVNAPIGLDIGAVSPAELAVSIMAEITMLRRGGTGQSMAMTFNHTDKLNNKQKTC